MAQLYSDQLKVQLAGSQHHRFAGREAENGGMKRPKVIFLVKDPHASRIVLTADPLEVPLLCHLPSLIYCAPLILLPRMQEAIAYQLPCLGQVSR
jgi:hypothetical protein